MPYGDSGAGGHRGRNLGEPPNLMRAVRTETAVRRNRTRTRGTLDL